MTKAELIEAIAKKHGANLTKKALTDIVDAVFDEIGDFFVKAKLGKGGAPKFTYPGFGTFTKKKRGARKGRNPRTGEELKIAPTTSIGFAPGVQLKDRLNKK